MKRHFFQFSLRAMLVAMTLAAISAAFWPRRAERLEGLVDSFNHSILNRQYEDAERITARTCYLYPNEVVSKQMEIICKTLRAMNRIK